VTLLSGLAIVRDAWQTVLATALDGVIARLREAKGFARPLMDTGLYRSSPCRWFWSAGNRGRLRNAEPGRRNLRPRGRDGDQALPRRAEPVMILSLAVLIGGIVLSILWGVMGMSELVQ
jgi:general secretion pathway protein F